MKREENLWYKDAIFYQVNIRAFYDSNGSGHGDLGGLIQKLDYLKSLGVTCLWLMPFYPSPRKDDGYDISDFINIHPDYGTLVDYQHLLEAAHVRGLRVIIDLVMNHTSDQHPWFQTARKNRASPYRDYYVWSDSDQKYNEARIIFVDVETSNWSWDEQAGQFFWHRFYRCQPDLNYDNPLVQEEMLKVAQFWLELGTDGFRVDAVPYLFERETTNCENLPETHAYLRKIRRFIDEKFPGRILLCEANQWPEDVRQYFGNGDEFHMGFHFPLMPRIFMAIRQENASPLAWALEHTPPIPENCQWCTFLRNHDELTLEMISEDERQYMWREYAPEPRMRLNLGIRRRLAPLLDNDRRKIELVNALLFSLPGSPIIYYGDEIGMGDNINLPDRNGVRTPMQWAEAPNAGFSTAPSQRLYAPVIDTPPYHPALVNVIDQTNNPDSLLVFFQKLINLRKQHDALGLGNINWLSCSSAAVACFVRESKNERLLACYNLSAHLQTVDLHVKAKELVDLFSQVYYPPKGDGHICLTLRPYQYLWLDIK